MARIATLLPLANTVTVAQWIIDQVRRSGELRAEVAVAQIGNLFGAQFTMTDDDRMIAIRRSVIAQVRRTSAGQVDYDARRRCFSTASLIAKTSLESVHQRLGNSFDDEARNRLRAFYKTKIVEAEKKIAIYVAELSEVVQSRKAGISGKLRACRTELELLRRKVDAL